jgi:hypothetical protein
MRPIFIGPHQPIPQVPQPRSSSSVRPSLDSAEAQPSSRPHGATSTGASAIRKGQRIAGRRAASLLARPPRG